MQQTNSNKLVLGYWPLRGRAQVIRHLLSYLNIQFTEKVYNEAKEWFNKDKSKLSMDFSNLPYLIDGDFSLTQTDAICRYIIQRAGNQQLLGKNIQDKVKVTCIFNVIIDICTETNGLFYDKEYQSKLDEKWQKVRSKLDYLNNFIGDRQTCLEYLTYVDFVLAEYMGHYIVRLYGDKSQKYKFLFNVTKYVEGLEGVKRYYQRDNAVKQPHVAQLICSIKY